MKIKAAVLEKLGSPLRIVELEHEPLKTGQVLVKVFYSGVCRSQLMEVKGGRGENKWLPHLLGHEGSGVVVSVGSGVSKVKPGDEVILTWIKSSGIEAVGAIYQGAEGSVNSGAVTTFSNYTVVSENRLVLSGKNIAGSWGGGVKPDRDIPMFFSAFSHANMPLNSLLTKRYSLEPINDALSDLENGQVFRPLIEMQH